jgi:hypothetical protein
MTPNLSPEEAEEALDDLYDTYLSPTSRRDRTTLNVPRVLYSALKRVARIKGQPVSLLATRVLAGWVTGYARRRYYQNRARVTAYCNIPPRPPEEPTASPESNPQSSLGEQE